MDDLSSVAEKLRAAGWTVLPPMSPEEALLMAQEFSTDGLSLDVSGLKPEIRRPGVGSQSYRLLHGYVAAARTASIGGKERGFTDEQAAEWAGLLASCYWKRTGELRGGGLIEPIKDEEGAILTRTGKSGVSRMICRITSDGRDYLSRADVR